MENYLLPYLFICLGVIISIVLPILRALLPEPATHFKNRGEFMRNTVNPYFVVGAFSLLSALLIVAGLPEKVDCKVALLAGYAWDSTLQKMRGHQ